MDAMTVYWIMFLSGLIFSIVSVVLSGFGHAFGGHDYDFSADHQADLGGGTDTADFGGHAGAADAGSGDFYHGGGEIALSPLSPITIAAFVGGFGGGGLIGMTLKLGVWSVAIALPVGFVLAFLIYYFMYLINKTNVSSEAHASDTLGLTAEIITPIMEDKVGEIAYILSGSRYTSPARSIDGRSILKGRAVKIWRVVGSTCYVKEILPEEAEKPEEEGPVAPVI